MFTLRSQARCLLARAPRTSSIPSPRSFTTSSNSTTSTSTSTSTTTAKVRYPLRSDLPSTNADVEAQQTKAETTSQPTSSQPPQAKQQHHHQKTVEEVDAELREKLEAMSGEGGAAGLELEGGKPVAMKRGVRENMFRVI